MFDAPASTQAVLLLAALLSAATVAIAWRSRSHFLALPLLHPQAGSPEQDHCVIIPAHNQASRIARCVRSFPGSLTVVIDDRSSDATAQRARDAGAEVRPAEPVPEHWMPAPSACWTGALYTSSDWILFADPHTWYDPRFLPALLAFAARENLAAVSVFPAQLSPYWLARTLLPYALGVSFAAVNPAAVNDPRRPEALANGECLLVRRKSYDFLGGHRAVAASPCHDLAFARLLKRHRMSGRVIRCESLAYSRRCASFAALWRDLEITTLRFQYAHRRASSTAAALLMAAWLPVLLALLSLKLWIAAALFFFVPALAWRPWYPSWRDALLCPLACCLYPAVALSAAARSSLGWRGGPRPPAA